MAISVGRRGAAIVQPLRSGVGFAADVFVQPVRLFRGYQASSLRPDLIAGLTVAVILLPQSVAYALIAELPVQTGLYTAIVAAVVGALWGSSDHLQTGPTSAASFLVLSSLILVATPGTADYVMLAGLMAVMVGAIRLAMGLARLGVLVNFVSYSVIVGYTAGAAVLIAATQLGHLLGLKFPSYGLVETLQGVVVHLPETHVASAALGLGTIVLILLLKGLNPKLPGALIAMVASAAIVAIAGLGQQGVAVIGELPRSLPPLSPPPVDMGVMGKLAPGALAIAAIGLVESASIARSIAGQSGQRLDSNQEFVGQGLASIAAGLFSGYPAAGSLTRTAVNYEAGARTRLASVFSGLFVLVAMLVLAPFTAYVPRAALSGVLILTAYGMVDRAGIVRILRGARADAVIMVVTFLATLLLSLEFAVLGGILLSFAVYIVQTSVPKVFSVLPDEWYRHFVHQPQKPPCPQLAVIDILGDLYFGAVSHVEKAIDRHLAANPTQRLVLLRMQNVQQCDFSGIYALESIVRSVRDGGGDVFMVRVRESVLKLMNKTGFWATLNADHFLEEDTAISHLFYKVLDPAVCIYECDVRAFRECQNLPKAEVASEIPLHTAIPAGAVAEVSARELWQRLHNPNHPPQVIDVREPREFRTCHIPEARPMPLSTLLGQAPDLAHDCPIVFVCRSGRRSRRAAYVMQSQGYEQVAVLQGGMLAWEAANLLCDVGACLE